MCVLYHSFTAIDLHRRVLITNIYDIEIPNSFFTRTCPIELDVFIEGKVDPFLQKGVDSTEIPVGQLGLVLSGWWCPMTLQHSAL